MEPRGATTTVYLGLGSNQGDRRGFIDAAVAALSARDILCDLCLSPLYETDAVTDDPQPPFLNAVVRGETALSCQTLLVACLETEAALGRVRPMGRARAPRTIDIDLLLYGDAIIDTPTLTVPHPSMLARAFVLIPLADVAAPDLVHPVTGVALTAAVPSSEVRLVPVS